MALVTAGATGGGEVLLCPKEALCSALYARRWQGTREGKQPIVVEVALLHPTVFHGDSSIQRSAQPLDDAANHLLFYATRVNHDPAVEPRWFRDGEEIYFASDGSGTWQVWSMSATGGMAKEVTKTGG